jgi:hypothetical protein
MILNDCKRLVTTPTKRIGLRIEAHHMDRGLGWSSEHGIANTRRNIIRWREARRLSFNAIVGAVGVASWILVLVPGSAALKPGEDFEEPMMMIAGPVVYCLLANICYTLGWIVDTAFYTGTPRTRLYKSGLILSVVLTALPGVWAVVAWLITLYTGRKLD